MTINKQTDRRTDGRTDGRVNTAYCELFAGIDLFMSLHKPVITVFLTPKIPLYEFTNSFHA